MKDTSVLSTIFLSLFCLLAACTLPSDTQNRTGTLKVTIDKGSFRTVVPDFAGVADSFDISLSSQEGFAPKTASGVPSGHIFSSVEAGLWDVSVKAFQSSLLLAEGTVSGLRIEAGQNSGINVNLAPVGESTGTGSFSLALRVPGSTGIDTLTWSLENFDGNALANVGQNAFPLTAQGSDLTATLTGTGLPSGAYSLVLRFHSGSTEAGTFREALNIFNGLTSNKWIKADGSLAAERTFLPGEFYENNAEFSEFVVSTPLLGKRLVPSSSTSTPFQLGQVTDGTFSFTLTKGHPAQSLSFIWNQGSSTPWESGAPSPLLRIQTGTNTLEVTVTAGNRVSSITYRVSFTGVRNYISPQGMEMVPIPQGFFLRSNNPGAQSTLGSFLMGRYLVTQQQYLQVMGSNPSYFTGSHVPVEEPSRPVENLTWYDAVDFCNTLSLKEGLDPVYLMTSVVRLGGSITSATVTSDTSKNGYRLPTWTEMVWMAHSAYNADHPGAVHPHSSTLLSGLSAGSPENLWLLSQGNFRDGTGEFPSGSGFFPSVPVGRRNPNPYSLYDVLGNVSQWLHDPDDGATPAGGGGATTNYPGPASGGSRMYFGGSTWTPSTDNTVASILFGVAMDGPGTKQAYLGFRVVRSVPRSVVYHLGTASSGVAPVDPKQYLEGSPATLLGNATGLRGPQIQDGITQRFLGWDTRPDGSGTSYAPGAAIPLGAEDLHLYPEWTTTLPGNTPNAMNGMIGPAGGWVFHDKGSTTEGWRYLEAAPGDQSSGDRWSPSDINITTTYDVGPKYGKLNTQSIIAAAGAGAYAAKRCSDLSVGGYGDWYLPTTAELSFMYAALHQNSLGGFTEGKNYWSCEWDSGSTAWAFRFQASDSGSKVVAQTDSVPSVRAIRAFTNASAKSDLVYLGTGGDLNKSLLLTYLPGTNAVILGNSGTFTKSGSYLQGWATTAGAAEPNLIPGGSFTVPYGDTILYPVWKPIPSTGMVGAWRLDNLGAASYGTSGGDLTLTAITAATDRFGRENGACYVGTGNGQKLSTGNTNLLFANNQSFTLSGWYRIDALDGGDTHPFWTNSGSGIMTYGLFLSQSSQTDKFLMAQIQTNGTFSQTINYNLGGQNKFGQWIHVSLRYTGGSGNIFSFFVDGVLVGTATYGGGGNKPTSMWIGGFQGAVDDFRVYNLALTDQEIRQLSLE